MFVVKTEQLPIPENLVCASRPVCEMVHLMALTTCTANIIKPILQMRKLRLNRA